MGISLKIKKIFLKKKHIKKALIKTILEKKGKMSYVVGLGEPTSLSDSFC